MASNPLASIPSGDLKRLAISFEQGALGHSISEGALRRVVPAIDSEAARYLMSLAESGWVAEQLGILCHTVATVRNDCDGSHASAQLVLSGPEYPGITMRKTSSVFRELIEKAKNEIVVASYVLHDGHEFFSRMAERRSDNPALRIRLFLNIERTRHDTTLSNQIIARYRHRFVSEEWPDTHLPELYYFRAALDLDPKKRASLHAKAVVIDRTYSLISSANLTKAAHGKNIEMGLLMEDPAESSRIVDYLEGLVEQQQFVAF